MNGRPEAWVGSDTRVFNTTKDNPDEGCAKVKLPDAKRKTEVTEDLVFNYNEVKYTKYNFRF